MTFEGKLVRFGSFGQALGVVDIPGEGSYSYFRFRDIDGYACETTPELKKMGWKSGAIVIIEGAYDNDDIRIKSVKLKF